jgi:hypothetical protein
MKLTARRLNRATLARQLLLSREPLGVIDAVHRVVALQAQEAPSPYLALWNRIADFAPADLDAALASHALVKATLIRITLHIVDAADYPAFHAAMVRTLRAARLGDHRFTATGLSAADADALLEHVLEFAAQARTSTEVQAMLNARLGAPKPRVWWALRTFAPLVHAPTGGPWSFGLRPSYVAARAPAVPSDRDESLRHLIRRYLAGFGPASVADIARFTLLARSTARAVLTALAGELDRHEGPARTELFDLAGAPLPAEDTPCPARLLGMWDSILLAYADRTRTTPLEYRPLILRRNGDVLPTVLVDGHVAGVWRPVAAGIEVTAFHPLPEQAWEELATEARSLVSFLAGREPLIYRRHANWWAAMPSAELRVLSA